ncbi:MAG: hypothetical protein AUJ54_09725 [Ignavibacteria bacterium CG1_02_37_35]|nr:MAG: hypothetical protein AUJ54_09725 [Ignavibacteria bacterium CG1_02_37_35]PIX94717.1 MAG: hypothetical protein COZ25_04125 [Ignavibacteria bacterium CG_4_10_14_3_um_filter_37_18]PJC59585.1 MAG: hypothetical protein CO025_05730 [Ignavibacteria bacterium CG_4_9_14_0_2_um_filter_37_13]
MLDKIDIWIFELLRLLSRGLCEYKKEMSFSPMLVKKFWLKPESSILYSQLPKGRGKLQDNYKFTLEKRC